MKVFCVGLSKTGTNSIIDALKKLGYSTCHCPDIHRVLIVSDKVDAIADSTVAPYMQMLDRIWPDAKFILTVREEEAWLDSCRRHFAVRLPPEILWDIHKWNRLAVWGRVDYDEETFKQISRAHIENVLEYFKDRPEKLLVMDICSGEGYENLCPFLGLPILDERFPHGNWDKRS